MARRVNTRFLVILSAVVVGGGAVAFTTATVLKRMNQNPERFVIEGQSMIAEGRWDDAAKSLHRAISLSPKDADLRVTFAEVMERVAATESAPGETIGRARQAYRSAMEINNQHLPALRGLLESYEEELKYGTGNDGIQASADIARKILAIDPNDRNAKVVSDGSTIRLWQRGIETDRAKIDAAVASIDELAAADVTDPETLGLLIDAYRQRAGEALRAPRTEAERLADARKQIDAAISAIDRAVKDPANVSAQTGVVAVKGLYLASQIYQGTDKATALQAQAGELLMMVAGKVKPEESAFGEIRILQADLALRNNDKATAEKLLTEAVAAAPRAIELRLKLAQILASDPTRRDEAVTMLTKPIPAKAEGSGFDVLATKRSESMMLLEATGLRIDSLPTVTDSKVKSDLRQQIENALTSLKDQDFNPAILLYLRGKMQLVEGDPVAAVATLNQAQTAANQNAGGVRVDDLTYLLGRAYMDVKQTGNAKSTFKQIAENPVYGVRARLALAQLYLDDNQTKEALEQLDILDKLVPSLTDLQRLRFAAYLKDNRRDDALALYAKLPATTKVERLQKAQGALLLGDRPAAIALLEDALKAFPDDAEIAINLAQQYQAAQQPDKARLIVTDALAKNPDNSALKLLQSRLDGQTQEQIIDQAVVDANKNPDPYLRAMQLSELSRMAGKMDEALAHLAEADKAKPGDARVTDQRFNILLSQGKFDEAAALVPVLSSSDADKAGGLIYRFRLALAQNKVADAEALGLELTQKMPAFAQSWLCYGQALQARNKPVDAIDKYNRALERQNNNADAYRGLIDCYYAIGKPEDAQRYITQARRSLPNDPTFRELEIAHTQNYGDPTPALALREADAKADPENKAKVLALANAYLKVAQFHAPRVEGKAQAEQNLTKAKEVLSKAVDKWPNERGFTALFADVSLNLNDVASAEKALTRFAELEEWKNKVEPQMMLGELYARTGRLDQAENAFNTALKISNDAPEVRQRFAAFLADRGKVTGAIELLPIDDKSPQVRQQRITILSAAGRFTEAEEAIKKSLEIDRDSLDMEALLASVYLDQGRFEDATSQAAKVLARDPKNQMATYVRGLEKLRRAEPDVDGAIADLTVVNELNPRNVDVRLALSDAQRQRGNIDGAIGTLTGGLQLNNANKVLRLRLLDLYVANDRRTNIDYLINDAGSIASLQSDPDWLAAEANAYSARGDFTKAAQRMKAAVALVPGNGNLQNAYIGLLIRAKDFRGAISEADKITSQSDVWWAHQLKATARKGLNDIPGATKDLQAALKSAQTTGNDDAVATVINAWAQQISPDAAIEQLQPMLEKSVRWKLQAASLQMEKRDFTAARATLESAMAGFDKATEPEQLQLLRFAGSFYLSVLPAEPEKSMEAYEKLLARTPNDLAALNNIACLLAESVTPTQPDKALEYSTRAYDSLRRGGRFDPMIFDTQGWMLVLNNRADDGIEVLRQVVNRSPFPEAHYHLAEAYLRLAKPYPEEAVRQLTAAKTAYDEAAKTRPVDPLLKDRLKVSLDKANAMLKSQNESTPAAGAN